MKMAADKESSARGKSSEDVLGSLLVSETDEALRPLVQVLAWAMFDATGEGRLPQWLEQIILAWKAPGDAVSLVVVAAVLDHAKRHGGPQVELQDISKLIVHLGIDGGWRVGHLWTMALNATATAHGS